MNLRPREWDIVRISRSCRQRFSRLAKPIVYGSAYQRVPEIVRHERCRLARKGLMNRAVPLQLCRKWLRNRRNKLGVPCGCCGIDCSRTEVTETPIRRDMKTRGQSGRGFRHLLQLRGDTRRNCLNLKEVVATKLVAPPATNFNPCARKHISVH